MAIVEESAEIAAPVDVVFAYVDDYQHTQEWMYGLDRLEPLTDQVRGVGATYDGVMKLGVTLKSRIRCSAWEQDRLLEITSIKGIRNTQRWTFTALDGDRTRLDARIEYFLPGGPAGATMAAAMKPFIGIAIKHTSQSLARTIEAL